MFLQVCPVCEHRNPRGSRFCNECGSPLQLRFCPACHAAEDVMSLECRSCGEKLPLVVIADTPPTPAQVLAASTESIWKTEAPQPALFAADDGGVLVTVHGGAAPAPAVEQTHAPVGEQTLPPESVWAFRTEAAEIASRSAGASPTSGADIDAACVRTKGPTIIERLHGAQAEPELRSFEPAPRPIALETTPDVGELNAESESEIEVSAEAETLVEACVGPVTYPLPDEIAIAETAQIDEIASQLREGAWRSAMSIDTGARTALAPALIHVWPPRVRRLSMHRVGLALAAVGVVAAAVYSVRLAPGTGAIVQEAAAPVPQPITRPAQGPAERVPSAAPFATAVPGGTPAPAVESTPAAPAATAAPVAEKLREKPDNAWTNATARAEAPQGANKAAPARRPAPATTVETVAPPATQARRAPAARPQPCTQAIAALGLCTPEATQEGK